MTRWFQIVLCLLLLQCGGCRIIGQTINLTLRTIARLLPIFLFVSVDRDGDGSPECSETYVLWVDPETGRAEVRGDRQGPELVRVVRAELTDAGLALELDLLNADRMGECSRHTVLVPVDGQKSVSLDDSTTLTAGSGDTWERHPGAVPST